MSSSLRIVVDTNVLISAALSKQSTPNEAVFRVIEHGELLASEASFLELATRLRRPKFEKYLQPADREEYLTLIHVVEVREEIRACRDPSDAKFLELAVSGAARAIISGGKDLLALHPFRNIVILDAAAFLARDIESFIR